MPDTPDNVTRLVRYDVTLDGVEFLDDFVQESTAAGNQAAE